MPFFSVQATILGDPCEPVPAVDVGAGAAEAGLEPAVALVLADEDALDTPPEDTPVAGAALGEAWPLQAAFVLLPALLQS